MFLIRSNSCRRVEPPESWQWEVSVQIRWLLACVALVGSSGECYSHHGGLTSAYAIHASSALGPTTHPARSPSDDELILQSYPWSRYRTYPRAIRSLVRRQEIEQGRCRGIPNALRACNRAWWLERRLERRGWCWGSEQPMASEAMKRWLRCSRDPHYRRGYNAGVPPPFSEQEIREMEREGS